MEKTSPELTEADIPSLKNKIAIVTGGGSGIGAATAAKLARSGARVAIFDIGRERAIQQAADLSRLTPHKFEATLGIPVDVADADSVESAVATVVAAWDKVDYL